MKLHILVLLVLLSGFGLQAKDAAAFRNEPDGFRGSPWGTTLGTLFSREDFAGFSSDEKSARYRKTGDDSVPEIDSVKLFGEVYSFYKGKLWKVELEARLLQAGRLLELFRAKYGEPLRDVRTAEFSREYTWSGTATDIILTTSLNYFDKSTADITSASIYSRKIKAAIDADMEPVPVERKLPIDSVEGFRGRKWGSGFIKGNRYLPLEDEPYFEYLVNGDDLMFEGIMAEQIRYRFYDNRSLQRVELRFTGRQNYLKLKNACFKLFGETSRYEHGDIRWIGITTTVTLNLAVDAQGRWLSSLTYYGFGSH